MYSNSHGLALYIPGSMAGRGTYQVAVLDLVVLLVHVQLGVAFVDAVARRVGRASTLDGHLQQCDVTALPLGCIFIGEILFNEACSR